MCWLADQFGIDRLRRTEVVLPNNHFFPDPYRGTVEDATRMMGRLCRYMDIDPDTVELLVSPDEAMPGAAGMYHGKLHGDRAVVRVAESQLADPPALAATLAHELAHELLLGGGLLDVDTADHELITDLLPVYLGVGVFSANATLREASGQYGQVSWWTMNRQGYLPSRMFGYALALFAFLRGEHAPSWAGYLRTDAASALRDGLRYLRQTGDTLFHPDTVATGRPTPGPAEALVRLRGGTATVRLATLWDVQEHGLTGPECLEAVAACLGDNDSAVATEAARALAVFGASAAPVVPRLREALWSRPDEVRAEAALTLGTLALEPAATVPELCALLAEPSRAVFCAAARALTQFGMRGDNRAVRSLLLRLETALVDCDDELLEIVLRALLVVAVDPEQCIREHRGRLDGELKRLALHGLAELRSPSDQEAP
jgi:hypothetical protein